MQRQEVSGFTPTLIKTPSPNQPPSPLPPLLHITHTSGYQPLTDQNLRAAPVRCRYGFPAAETHFRIDLQHSLTRITGSN